MNIFACDIIHRRDCGAREGWLPCGKLFSPRERERIRSKDWGGNRVVAGEDMDFNIFALPNEKASPAV
jgi:hypothetical protein